MAEYEPSLCWQCNNTNRHKCSWFNPADPQPVPGWVAERRVRPLLGETYTVKECPNFEPEPPRQVQHTSMPVSNVKGVIWDAVVGRWEVRIMGHGKKYYLGKYDHLAEAVAVRRAAERALARGEEPHYVRAIHTSACPGVFRDKNRWQARIIRKGEMYYLGTFKAEEDAIAARKAAEAALDRGEVPQKATQEEKRGGD